MSVLLLPPIFQFFDNNGDPLSNGFVYTYAAGTTTPLATYTNAAGNIAAPNPIELNAAGRPTSGSGAIWGQGAYKFIVRDANGVQVGDTLDNVTSFNSLADAVNAYAETFSGNGVQTVFTTSQPLGTDPKGLFVSTAAGLQEISVNGTFATDTGWSKGAGWTISGGVANAAGGISTAISQVPVISLVAGQAYAVTYTITVSAGALTVSLGTQGGVSRTASGTYREIVIASATTPIAFTGAGFTGTLDNVSITVATSQNMALLPVSSYTINGTTLTFASAPALGVNNIDVRAPSLLLGAATTAANLAQLYAAQSLTSANAAASSAALAALIAKWRPAVLVATTLNITLSGEQVIDTQLTSASRVLVKNQTNATQNGVYVSAAGAWTRATDADTASELLSQAVTVTAGSVNLRKSFINTNDAGFVLGTDPVTFTELLLGTMSATIYDPANIAQQLVGITASQDITTKTVSLRAGTATLAALKFASGVNLTTIQPGAIEYDGKVFYASPTQRGVVPTYQELALQTAVVGADSATPQSVFNLGVSLSASTIYEFEGFYAFSKVAGTNSHTFGVGFAGTATLNNINYEVGCSQSVNYSDNTQINSSFQQAVTNALLTGGLTSPTYRLIIRVRGIISVNAAGTFIPQYTLSAPPGGAYTTAVGSYFKITPLGASGANINVGPWA